MNCPNCKIDIEFTWSRYLKCGPFSNQTCPDCNARFKFIRPFTYYIWQIYTFMGMLGVLCITDTFIGENYFFVEIFLVILWVILYCIIDRGIESNLPTKPH